MAYININTAYPAYDGMPITFVAPCDCTAAEGLTVNSANYVFKDAHGNTLTGIGNVFSAGAYVKVILDVTNGCAYIQNGDNNSYQNGRIVVGTEMVQEGDASPYPEGTLYVVIE